METRLENILPILGVENDCILSKQGDVTVAYKTELPEIFTMSSQDYEAFHQTWIKAIKILPKRCVFHKQDWYVETKYHASFKDEPHFLSRSSERFLMTVPIWIMSATYISQKNLLVEKLLPPLCQVF
jgi:hypothetical protein